MPTLNDKKKKFQFPHVFVILFALIIIMKYMLSSEEFSDMMNELSYEIDRLDGIVNVVPLNTILNKIGFPDNWRDIELLD